MNQPQDPFPIFPQMAVFVRCVNEGLDFPFNTHVEKRLAQVDPTCQPVQTCRYAADFLLSLMHTKRTPWAGRYLNYTAVLHLVLNWSFLVDRRPLSCWDSQIFKQFLEFVKTPPESWVSNIPTRPRFLKNSHPVSTEQLINPAWRPRCICDPRNQIVSTVMRQVRSIASHFLDYLWLEGARATKAPGIGTFPDTPDGSGVEAHNLDVLEIKWLFDYLDRHMSKPQYAMLRFLAAVARFTNIPFAAMIRDETHIGLLSQFRRNLNCPEYRRYPSSGFTVTKGPAGAVNPLPYRKHHFSWDMSDWDFVENIDAPLENRHPLPWIFLPYVEDYARFQGYELTAGLPDVPTLPTEHWINGMSTDLAYDLFSTLRIEIATVAGKDGELSPSSAAKLKHITFGGLRRSERANIKAALRIEHLSFKTR